VVGQGLVSKETKGRHLGLGGWHSPPPPPTTKIWPGQHHVLDMLRVLLPGVRVLGLCEGARSFASRDEADVVAGRDQQPCMDHPFVVAAGSCSPVLSLAAPLQPPPNVCVNVVVCGDACV